MKKRYWIILLLLLTCCITWFSVARQRAKLSPAPGWVQFGNTSNEEHHFSFWLPPYYKGVEPAIASLMLSSVESDFGEGFSLHNAIKNTKIAFAAQDTRSEGFSPKVMVIYGNSTFASSDIKKASDEINHRIQLLPNANLIENEVLLINGLNAVKLVYELFLAEDTLVQVQYIILDNDIVWSVVYIPDKNNSTQDFENFDLSIQTFEVKK